MSLKKNFFWNLLLSISNYIFPFITFPYVTRVLGAGNIGIANFALSIVDYAILFSTFGMTMVGIKTIAQNSCDKQKLSDAFSSLVSLHILLTSIVVFIYVCCIYFVPQFSENRTLCLVGITKLVANVFLVEWLFQGMQDFKYITIRTIFVRLFYVISVFIFVRNADDYDMFFYVSIAQVIVNALVNWRYSHKFISFNFSLSNTRKYLMPVLSMGINTIFLSFYTTFNVLYLGLVCAKESVGYFTTAIKLYTIFISFITAYNSVFVPYLNTLYTNGDLKVFSQTVSRSIHIISLVSIPIMMFSISLAPEIINFIAGPGYERAIIPFQIISVQLILVGLAQIFENQVLLAFGKYKLILFATVSTTILAVLIMLIWTSRYAEIAAASAVAIPHIFELIFLIYFAKKVIPVKNPLWIIIRNIIICIPFMIFSHILKPYVPSNILFIFISFAFIVIFYLFVNYLIIKDEFLIAQISNIRKRISNRIV